MEAGRTTRTAHKYFTLVYNESVVVVVAIVVFLVRATGSVEVHLD